MKSRYRCMTTHHQQPPFFTGEPEAATNYVFFRLPPGCIVGLSHPLIFDLGVSMG
jgi:hypothetical protein